METKNRVVKGSKVPSINLSKEILSLLTRLEDYEVKEILVGIRDYVYKDKEPSVDEEITDIMEMVLDNVNHIAAKHLNGSKGGRPRKNNTDLEPNTEFETVVKISPNEAEIDTDEAEVPQEEESLPEAAGMAEYEVVITDINNTGMGTYIGTLNELSFREVMPETRRVEQEESIDKSMEHIMKCLSVFDINKAKHQVFKSRSIDENMKRVADCLDPLLGGFSQTDRSRFYISLVEEVLNN